MKIVIIGSHGSGKGTYASRLSKIFNITHVSIGDIFRENIANGTELGKKVAKFVNSGDLVPDEITIEITKERLNRPDCKNGFILDDYPRTLKQAQALEKITNIDFAVNLVVPEWLIVKRLANRRTCKNCGEIYNIINVKPKKEGICDKCGGELIQRKDDEEEAIKKGLEKYEIETKPLIDYYKKKGVLRQVSCDRLESPPEENIEKILKVLGVKNV